MSKIANTNNTNEPKPDTDKKNYGFYVRSYFVLYFC